MKRTSRWVTSLIVAALAFSTFAPAQAADVVVTSNFSGFAFEKSVVTLAMKKKIKAWVDKNATDGFTIVSCTGYTGYNANGRSKAFLNKLALDRARNVCNYVKSIKTVIAINSTEGFQGTGKEANARKVTVRLIAPGGGGSGEVVIGSCDKSIDIKMRSRIIGGDFSFDTITLSNISTTCRGNLLDLYLLDEDGNQLAAAFDLAISATSLTFNYARFTPSSIRSNQIRKVAIEIRSP